MSAPRRRLRPPFGGPSRRRPPGEPDGLTRALRDEYAAPDEPRYWEGFEARVVAAVRDGAARAATTTTGAFRAVPAAAVDWWHALARWAQPGLVAAAVTIVIAAAVFVDARATAEDARAHTAFRDVLDAPLGAPPAPGGGPSGGPTVGFATQPAGPRSAAGSAERRDDTFRDLLPRP